MEPPGGSICLETHRPWLMFYDVRHGLLLFAEQRNSLIADTEDVVAELNKVSYRISAEVVTQLNN